MKVLIVDDENDVRRIARLSLTRLGGMEVVEAENGFDCLDCVARVDPDVILLDVMMPGLDGPSTFRALRGSPATAHIPIVFLTAKALRADQDSLGQLGAAGILSKPFDPLGLPAEVRALLEKSTH